MIIQFFSDFVKKENSTKRPTGTVSLSLTGVLKEPCSTMRPTVKIERLANDANPCIYTYAIIPSFRRLYFVDDWVWANGLWEVTMHEDVLGTWKDAIGSQTEYILRTDSTTDFNGDITDTTYPATTTVIAETVVMNNVFTDDLSVGIYIVGIISGGQSQAVGAISYYAMSSAEFGALKNTLFSDDNLEIMRIIDSQGIDLTSISQDVLKTMYNPYQYIASCMWFPFTKSAIPNSTHVSGIKMGWWNYPNLSGDLLYAQTLELGFERHLIDAHPQASRGEYLNYAPYTRRSLVGRFGCVPIDTTFFKVGDMIAVSYLIDLITGQCCARINRDRLIYDTHYYDLITQRDFLLGVPIQLAQVGTDYLGTAVNAINTVPNAIGGAINGLVTGRGAVAGAIAGATNGIYNTLQSAMPQMETSGQNGSFLAPTNQTHAVDQFYQIVDEDITHRGRPLCELRQINTLSGFILCAEGDLDLNCLNSERDAIRDYLTTGFFWE